MESDVAEYRYGHLRAGMIRTDGARQGGLAYRTCRQRQRTASAVGTHGARMNREGSTWVPPRTFRHNTAVSLELWTWQHSSWTPSEVSYDWSRSEYRRSHAGYCRARQALHAELRTDQFLWCLCSRAEWPYFRGSEDREWAVHVEEKDVSAFVDSDKWNKLIDEVPSKRPIDIAGLLRDVGHLFACLADGSQPEVAVTPIVRWPLPRTRFRAAMTIHSPYERQSGYRPRRPADPDVNSDTPSVWPPGGPLDNGSWVEEADRADRRLYEERDAIPMLWQPAQPLPA